MIPVFILLYKTLIKLFIEMRLGLRRIFHFTGGVPMYCEPEYSPWGEIQRCETLAPGIFFISTASHGGILVSNTVTRTLSDAARECGFWDGIYLCYEEDCQACVVLRELLDRDRQNVPSWVKDTVAFERDIDRSLQRYNPGYWEARRESRMIHPRPRQRWRRSACVR